MGLTTEKMLDAALQYQERGYSIIPIRNNKKPYLKSWKPFQKEKADDRQIIKWWNDHPNANIGIVTGEISNLTVIDLDSSTAIATFNASIEEPLATPIAQTPRGGQHVYFELTDGLRNASNVLNKTDIRAEGGYIIAPPSQNDRGQYTWTQGQSIQELNPAAMPAALYNVFINAFNKGGFRGESIKDNGDIVPKSSQVSPKVDKYFVKGNRDDSLFHATLSLIKGGADEEFIINTIGLLGENCNPPFPEKEIVAKIQSAFQRAKSQEKNISLEVEEWVLSSNGVFLSSDVVKDLQLSSRNDKKNVYKALARLAEKGICEKTGNRNGQYRSIDNDCPEIDFINADTTSIDVKLPLGLHDQATISPNDLILFAGEANSGKSGLLYNIAKDNKDKFKINWFSSEGGAAEFKKRLQNFELPLSEWKSVSYHERSGNFPDVIKPGKSVINIIDYLELHDEFYKVGGILADIQRKLNGAIAIVALQKNPGVDVGLGGFRTLEKPRLAVAVSPGKIKIIKAKHWKTFENPNGLQRKFKLAQGCKVFPEGEWHRD